MIYFDNAATTMKKPDCVIEAVAQAMKTFGNSGRSAHNNALDASRCVYGAREKIAQLFRLDAPERVVFTSNSTEALNTAIFGILNDGDHVISTDLEHNSVLRPLYALENVEKTFLPADRKGNIRYEDFKTVLKKNTRAIVTTHASNLTGNVLDIGRIAAFAKENGLLYIVDASQSAGVLDIDMEKDPIDVLCFTGHKSLMGPQGTGGMCIRNGVEIRPLKTGGTGVQTYLEKQPEQYPVRLEAGTLNAHGIAGLSAALDFLKDTGTGIIYKHEAKLAGMFYEGISGLEGVEIYGDFSAERRAPVVSLNIRDYDSSAVSEELMETYHIATRPGAHCAPRMHRALGTESTGAVRFSFGFFNTEEEVEEGIRAVREIAQC